MNVAGPIRAAILATPAITEKLTVWEGEPSVHTRRPVPEDVKFPMIAISPDIAYTDQDGLNSGIDVITRDVAIYGKQPDDYRTVEAVGHMLRKLFHRNNAALFNDAFHVISVNATGPIVAPSDDEKTIGRIISLTMRIQEK